MMTDSISVTDSTDRGRGVFATRFIPAGSEVIRALPFALVPNDAAMLHFCCVCLAPASGDYAACADCGMSVMCPRCKLSPNACRVHADECSALKRLKAAPAELRPKDTRSLRLLLRCLCARWRMATQPSEDQYLGEDGSWWGDGDVAADDFEDIEALVAPPSPEEDSDEDGDEAATDDRAENGDSDGDELSGTSLATALFEMAKQARFFLDSEMRVGHATCVELMGRLCCNSLTVYGHLNLFGETSQSPAELREIGVAVSASVAMLNHDCQPNADWALDDDGCLVVTALQDLPRGAELCLSYVDVRLPAAVRQRRLRRCFFFDCKCAACLEGVSRWSCALCGSQNGAFVEVCTGAHCDALRSQMAMPVLPRGGNARPTARGGSRVASRSQSA